MTTWVQIRAPLLAGDSPAENSARVRTFDVLSSVAAISVLALSWVIMPMVEDRKMQSEAKADRSTPSDSAMPADKELVVSAYIGAPYYYRSNVHLTRPDGTDLELKRLGWDGDALYFPIDGGVRSINWSGSRGFMIDFLHNKAIARLGKGAHGRELKNGVVEEVEATGTLKGKPAPERIKLTDLFERLEFTHGHNVLLFTPVIRFANLTPRVRPYFGIGAGVAVPHVEVRFASDGKEARTGEYQYAGPALQALAGLELRSGRVSYYLEYKFTWATIAAALTGGEGSKNLQLPSVLGVLEGPGDLLRQVKSWWHGEEPKYGRLSTRLSSHQIFIGAGYVWPRGKPQ